MSWAHLTAFLSLKKNTQKFGFSHQCHGILLRKMVRPSTANIVGFFLFQILDNIYFLLKLFLNFYLFGHQCFSMLNHMASYPYRTSLWFHKNVCQSCSPWVNALVWIQAVFTNYLLLKELSETVKICALTNTGRTKLLYRVLHFNILESLLWTDSSCKSVLF